jgi:hypothetical protein
MTTEITDVEHLVAALGDLGFPEIEVYDRPRALIGFQGDERAQSAHVIVRRKFIGEASNDIGFLRRADGRFQAIISEYDRREYDERWLGRLTQRYAYHCAMAALARQDFTVVGERTEADGRIRISLRRMA